MKGNIIKSVSLILLSVLLLSSCGNSPKSEKLEEITESKEQYYEAENDNEAKSVADDVVESGKNYAIYFDGKDYYSLKLFDANGDLADTRLFYWNPPKICEHDDGIIEFTENLGTGTVAHRFFDPDTGCTSEMYFGVAAYRGGLVCRYSFADNLVVVGNVFDKDMFYREYDLGTAPHPVSQTSIISAEFDADSKLNITYKAENGEEKSVTVDLMK